MVAEADSHMEWLYLVEVCVTSDILRMHLRLDIEDNVAENAGESEEILILEPAARRPLCNEYAELVLTLGKVLRKLKIGRSKRVLAVADVVAVQIEDKRGFHSLERNEQSDL